MRIGAAAVLLISMVHGLVQAGEHPACRDLDYRYAQHPSQQLRAIAASCEAEEIADLFYHRAYHAELIAEGEALRGLIAYTRRDSGGHFDAYRLYIAMIEAFAPVWYPVVNERAAFLNGQYEHHSEIAELRLHGYDMVADRLERQAAAAQLDID